VTSSGPGNNEEGDNPFAAPVETRPRGRFILLPGWILILFAAIAALVPFSVGQGTMDLWITAVMYGAPGGVAVLVLAPNNLRYHHDRKQAILALALVGLGVVVGVCRIVLAV